MGLREDLLARGLPETTHPIRKGRVVDIKAARVALDEATRLRDKAPGIDPEHERAVYDARARLDDCYEDITIRALAPADYEALVSAHPPTDEQADDGYLWNPESFVPALLAATVDLPWSLQDWCEMCTAGPLALGEITDLFQAAERVNGRATDARLGKG